MNEKETGNPDAFAIFEKVIFLKKTQLFASIQTQAIGAIAEIAEEVTYAAGEHIVDEKDVGDAVFFIRKGRVAIKKKYQGEQTLDLATLSEGDCFGEMAIFDSQQRSANVVAETDCTLLRIKGDDLIDVILDYPYIGIELLKIFIRRLRKANATISSLSRTRDTGSQTNTGR
jgi:CRP-like cAMP-binding protein